MVSQQSRADTLSTVRYIWFVMSCGSRLTIVLRYVWVIVESRRGLDKGLALLDILLQFRQARFQQLLLLCSQLSNGMDLFNTVRLEGCHVSVVQWMRVSCAYTELNIR